MPVDFTLQVPFGPDDWESDEGPPILAALRTDIHRRRRLGDGHFEARRWAYGAALEDWQRRYWLPPIAMHCAGCGKPIGAAGRVVALQDGYADHDADCLQVFGRRWRSAAAKGLAWLGISPSEGLVR